MIGGILPSVHPIVALQDEVASQMQPRQSSEIDAEGTFSNTGAWPAKY